MKKVQKVSQGAYTFENRYLRSFCSLITSCRISPDLLADYVGRNKNIVVNAVSGEGDLVQSAVYILYGDLPHFHLIDRYDMIVVFKAHLHIARSPRLFICRSMALQRQKALSQFLADGLISRRNHQDGQSAGIPAIQMLLA
jgi:hypothetical protein